MKRVTITLPDDLAELVDLKAQRRQMSFSEVVRLLIALGLIGVRDRESPWPHRESTPPRRE